MQNTYLLKKIAYDIPLISEFLSSLYFILKTNAIENIQLKNCKSSFSTRKIEFSNVYVIYFLATIYKLVLKKLITIPSKAETDVLNINTKIQRIVFKGQNYICHLANKNQEMLNQDLIPKLKTS